MFGEIDHIGIAVEDLDAAIALYRDQFGMREQHRETVEEQGVHAVLLEIGDAHIELIAPIGPETGVARFIERNGEGMHHVAYRTDDIDDAVRRLVELGMRMIDREPRVGIRNSRVAFIHPKSTGGVLTEIVQPAEDH